MFEVDFATLGTNECFEQCRILLRRFKFGKITEKGAFFQLIVIDTTLNHFAIHVSCLAFDSHGHFVFICCITIFVASSRQQSHSL